MNASRGKPLVVWRFHDGKPGHDRQSAGLLQALAARRALHVHSLARHAHAVTLWHWVTGRLPASLAHLPPPALIVGAGHACELALLVARRARGGRSVYLMKPSLPVVLFDLCFVPHHDGVAAGPHVEPTQGVLNDVRPGSGARTGPVPILVGGPSAHHAWDEKALLQQIASLVFGSRERRFTISDSRRTPASTSARLRDFAQPGVEVVSHRDTPPDFVTQTLAQAAEAWVTADSVSMLFEALTAGCAVGLLDVPAKRADRISGIAPGLIRDGLVTPLEQWRARGSLPQPAQPLAEAARCAEVIERRLLADG